MNHDEFIAKLKTLLQTNDLESSGTGIEEGEPTDEPIGEFMPTSHDRPIKVNGRIWRND